MKYLKGTSNYGIHYGGDQDPELEAFTDSELAGDLDQRKSTSGELFKKARGAQDPELEAFTDSELAGDLNQRKSTSGELFKKARGAIIWSASRQPLTTLSSCEAELVAICSAAKTALLLQRFLGELGHSVKPIIQIDNTSTI